LSGKNSEFLFQANFCLASDLFKGYKLVLSEVFDCQMLKNKERNKMPNSKSGSNA
jgi:hypothetical protein